MSNFDFLLSTEAFGAFARAAVAAEKIYEIDPAAAVVNCRRAMEFAVKWMYSVDGALVLPWDDRLNALMEKAEEAYKNYEFHAITHAVNDFCVVTLYARYLDIIKDRLYCEDKAGCVGKDEPDPKVWQCSQS